MQSETLASWLHNASRVLSQSDNPDTCRLDAELIACHILQLSRTAVYTSPDTPVNPEQGRQLERLLERRISGEPIAYMLGKREFWTTELIVSPAVLVPRPETETLVEAALARAAALPTGCILDLGTGTAAIAIAMAQELPWATVVAVERDSAALSIASTNIRNTQCENLSLVQAHWLDCMTSRCASLVLANPPYLASNDEHLDSLSFEPTTALVSGPTGLEDLMHIIQNAQRVAKPGALVMLEHGCEQANNVRDLFLDSHYRDINTLQDLAGLDRISYAYVPDEPE